MAPMSPGRLGQPPPPRRRGTGATVSLVAGMITVASLASLAFGLAGEAWTVAAPVAVLTGAAAMLSGGLVLGKGRWVAPTERRRAFLGAAMGSLLLAAAVLAVLSTLVTVQASSDVSNEVLPVIQQELAEMQRCIGARGTGRESAAAALQSCGCGNGHSHGLTGFSCGSLQIVSAQTGTPWALGALVLTGWASAVLLTGPSFSGEGG